MQCVFNYFKGSLTAMIESHSVFSQKQTRSLSKDRPTPLYFQLYKILRNGILDGSFADGALLPTEGQLSAEFDVSRITSKRAMDELAREGLVERHRGRGTHVTHQSTSSPVSSPMVGLLQEVESIGQNSTAITLQCRMAKPPQRIRQLLGVADDQEILQLRRVRQHDDIRFGYYSSWTRVVELPEDPSVFEHTPRMPYFRSKGLKVSFIKQSLTACAANAEAARALGVERGTALLSLTRLAFRDHHSQGFPVDYLRVLYHPERFEYRIDLELEDG
jgi:GntR family transcriptional regulator